MGLGLRKAVYGTERAGRLGFSPRGTAESNEGRFVVQKRLSVKADKLRRQFGQSVGMRRQNAAG